MLMISMKMKTDDQSPYATAIRLLAMRAMSRAELRNALLRRGFEPTDADAAVDRITELHFIDEPAYAESLVRRYAARGYGKRALFSRLRAHGLDDEPIRAALSALPENDDALDALAMKFLRGDEDVSARRRATAALLRRGFSINEINRALGRVCGAQDGVFEDE
ncbi:MAG: regulatory protein RecX [Clostridiaceae bacterium]|nr:regulatory protein RecX [Clostridiaceae bacterium]